MSIPRIVKTGSSEAFLVQSRIPAELLERIERCGVVAVLVVDELAHAVPLATALMDGGIDVMELTLRTPVALDALRAIRAEVPGMVSAVGTVLTPEQAGEAAIAGAAFGVAPGLSPRVVRAARKVGLPFAPGVATASDLEAALELGCREVKFFPAESTGGMSYLKSMAAPYAHLGRSFCSVGGHQARPRARVSVKLTRSGGRRVMDCASRRDPAGGLGCHQDQRSPRPGDRRRATRRRGVEPAASPRSSS